MSPEDFGKAGLDELGKKWSYVDTFAERFDQFNSTIFPRLPSLSENSTYKKFLSRS
jgi:hypothetical protein